MASDDSEHRGLRGPRLNRGAAAGDDGRGSNAFDEDLERDRVIAGFIFGGFAGAFSLITSGETLLQVLGVGILLIVAALCYRLVVECRDFERSIREFDEDYGSERGGTCA